MHLEITYSLDWHLPCDENWNEKWPAEWTVDWDRMLPRVPEGVRLHVFDYGDKTPISSHNFEHHGGRVSIADVMICYYTIMIRKGSSLKICMR